jgi:sugar/nucleoside kinase (ribokinase family)
LTNDTRVVEKEIELLCAGNAIVDVFAHDKAGLARRYGLCEPVQHVEIEKLKDLLPELGEITAVSGGGAANAAKIAALLGAKVGFTGAIGSANFVGDDNPVGDGDSVGTDRFGRLFEEDLKSTGVKTLLVKKRSPTGICLVLQTGDGTRIAASPSASLEFSEEDINEEEVRKAKIVVIDGFMLGRRGLVRRLLALADKHGAAAAIDMGSAAIAAEEAEEIASYIASLDAPSSGVAANMTHNVTANIAADAQRHSFFLFMNEDEAVSFHNGLDRGRDRPVADFEQAREFFKSLTKERPSLVTVVKLGERGAICFAGGDCFHAGTEAVEPVETTGAGDAFCGAFLTAWARGKPLPECAALGNKAARIVIGGAGTRVDKNAFRDLAALLEDSAVS